MFYAVFPFLYVKSARNPTLILQGEADPVDPIGQKPGTLPMAEALRASKRISWFTLESRTACRKRNTA